MDIEKEEAGKGHVNRQKGHKIVGLTLSAMGFFWLSQKAGWMIHDTDWFPHHSDGSIVWPLVVIAIGLLFIFSIGRKKRHS